ncbi:hypothetical protein SKAU_G00371210 [Synaphobranchus kaupii]|uniref:Uncharacterized protein n=1 Tax=Synaphobranchus kaupii TaxID=118154 RepID=A0A9Q1EG58_SYNKA|nr:hypothetical protein SKAU_G00371210 [Synaphobranchus kaupii]
MSGLLVQCPRCQQWCEKKNDGHRSVCAPCSTMLRRVYQFCWACRREWPHQGVTRGNSCTLPGGYCLSQSGHLESFPSTPVMSSLKNEDLLSDVEPLPGSAPPSPPHSANASLLTPSQSNWPLPSTSHYPAYLAHSWPSSPLPALASSNQVTARLYASLQRSRELEVKGLSVSGSLLENIERPRQVTFNLSSPDLCNERVTQLHLTPVLPLSFSKQLGECREAASSSPAPPPACLSPDVDDTALGRPMKGGEGGQGLELGQLADEMSFNLQARADDTCATVLNGRRHILDMENVRSHLQTMLRPTHDSTEPDRGSTILSSCILSERLRQDNESFESDNTAHLISAPMLADLSPPLSLSGLEELFPRYSRLRPDSAPLSAETQVLRDSLERERARRKHHEKQIQVLQNKALQLQQQLALAVSGDRKKDIMIEQLDKTLAKEQKEAAEEAQVKQQEVLLSFEQSLSQAAEALDREQKRTEEQRVSNRQLEQQLSELSEQQQEQRQQREQAQGEVEQLQLQAQEAQASLAQHREAWAGRERELQERLTLQDSELDREKSNRERETHQLQETQRELLEARFESQCSQLEVEFKLSVEQQVTERLAALQEDNAKTTASLREQHRKQLLDLSARHERELSAQLAQFKAELEEREERLRKLKEEYRKRVSMKQEEVVHLEASRRNLEAQRTELVTRLQGLMRSHWAEALRLLTLQGQMDEAASPSFLCERGTPPWSASDGDTGSRAWELPLRLKEGSSEASPESRPMSDVPQAIALQLSRERGEVREDLSSQDSSPSCPPAQPRAPEHDVSILLNHSHTFRPLEPLLDDTAVTVLGSCEMEELSAKALSGAEDRGYAMERGRSRERGYSSDRERREGGHSSEREENSGYGVHRSGMGHSGYSSSTDREVPRGYGAGGDRDRGHRAGVRGYGTARESASLPLTRRAGQRGEQVGVDRERGFPVGREEYRLGRGRMGARGHAWEVQEREAGGPMASQSLNASGTESIRDASYSSTVVSQAKTGFSRGLEGFGLGKSITPTHGLGRLGDAQGDLGTTRRPLGPTTQAKSPGSEGEDRQSELQYYITMLLDRSPGDPVDPSALDVGQPPAGQSSSGAKTGLGASWDSEQPKGPAAGRGPSSFQPTSSAATKTKLHPAALSPQMLSQLSRLLSQYRSQPDRAAPSLEELLACVLSGQANSSPQGPGDGLGDGPVHRNLDQKLSQASKKEQTAVPAPDRRSHPSRPAGGDRTQSQAPKGGESLNGGDPVPTICSRVWGWSQSKTGHQDR